MMKKIVILLAMVIWTMAAVAQVRSHDVPHNAGHLLVTVDSIETDRAYLMVTVMRDDFTPFDYVMQPSTRGSMVVEMRTPPGDRPFSVTAYEDVNLNRRLDLDDNLVPVEKSAVVHCRGGETRVTLTLVHYDLLLHGLECDSIAQPKPQTGNEK